MQPAGAGLLARAANSHQAATKSSSNPGLDCQDFRGIDRSHRVLLRGDSGSAKNQTDARLRG